MQRIREYPVSNNAKKSGPFDVKTVEALVALMSANDLSEIYLKDGSQHLRLRRGAAASFAAPMITTAAAPMAAAPVPGKSIDGPAPSAAAGAKKNLLEIKSETVGTFYAQAKPG